jgi:hypothetical protein
LPTWFTKLFQLPEGQVINPGQPLTIHIMPHRNDLCQLPSAVKEEADVLTQITFGQRLFELQNHWHYAPC